MMMNLFSSFDPTTSNIWSMNWAILMLILLLIPMKMYWFHNPNSFIFNSFIKFLSEEFKMIMNKSLVDGSMNIILMILIFIVWSNLSGLFPFIFTSTSHLMTTLFMALSVWTTFFFFRIIHHMKNFLAHLVPSGTPINLMMFMVLIESVSLVIRPITLSVRLSANMIAGHLLLTLLGNSFFSFSSSYYLLFYITQMALLILEFAVAMIQGYVFTMLMILYSLEI